ETSDERMGPDPHKGADLLDQFALCLTASEHDLAAIIASEATGCLRKTFCRIAAGWCAGSGMNDDPGLSPVDAKLAKQAQRALVRGVGKADPQPCVSRPATDGRYQIELALDFVAHAGLRLGITHPVGQQLIR